MTQDRKELKIGDTVCYQYWIGNTSGKFYGYVFAEGISKLLDKVSFGPTGAAFASFAWRIKKLNNHDTRQ
jgi:hypothetical protein